MLVGAGVSVGTGVDVSVGVGVALGSVVAVGKESLCVDSNVGTEDSSGLAVDGAANAKKRTPPMNKQPKRPVPPPSNMGKRGLIDLMGSFCNIVFPTGCLVQLAQIDPEYTTVGRRCPSCPTA